MRLVRGDRVLAAGDRFVLSELILEALQREARGALEVSTLDLPWPVEPYGPVAEVEEASGTEEQMIEAVNCVEVVVTQLALLTARVLEAANNLRLVVCAPRRACQRQRGSGVRKRSHGPLRPGA